MNEEIGELWLQFVQERHRVWARRQLQLPGPWTKDPVLATRKFTNVFRVLDPGSQFIFGLDTEDPRDTLARLVLYRFTNLPSTWRYLRTMMGRYPLADDMNPALVDLVHVWRDSHNEKVFSGAYVILPEPNRPGDKVVQAVHLVQRVLSTWKRWNDSRSQEERFEILRSHYGIGPFMAMQIVTDWGYTQHVTRDEENVFVVPGPGCIKGATAIELRDARAAIDWGWHAVRRLPDPPTLPGGRQPSLMDIQNCFCEFSKYVRGPRAGAYRAANPGPQAEPLLPSIWS